MQRVKFFLVVFVITSLIISVDQLSVHFLMEQKCYHFPEHFFTVIFLSLLAAFISLLFFNKYERYQKQKKEFELRETKVKQSVEAISKCQDVIGNFMNGLLLIELEVQEKGSVSEATIESLRMQMDSVNKSISGLAESYKLS